MKTAARKFIFLGMVIFLSGSVMSALPCVFADGSSPSFDDLYKKSIEDRAKASQTAQAAEQTERDYQKAKDRYDKAQNDFLDKWADASDAIDAYKYSKSSKEKSADANKPGSSLTPAERAALRAAADRLEEAEQESLSKQFDEDEAQRDRDAARRAMDEAVEKKNKAAADAEQAAQDAVDSEVAAQEADPDAYSEKSMHFGMGGGSGESDSHAGNSDDDYWNEFNQWLDDNENNDVTQGVNESNKTSETETPNDDAAIGAADVGGQAVDVDSPKTNTADRTPPCVAAAPEVDGILSGFIQSGHEPLSGDVVNEKLGPDHVFGAAPAQDSFFSGSRGGDMLNIQRVPSAKGNKGVIFRKE